MKVCSVIIEKDVVQGTELEGHQISHLREGEWKWHVKAVEGKWAEYGIMNAKQSGK